MSMTPLEILHGTSPLYGLEDVATVVSPCYPAGAKSGDLFFGLESARTDTALYVVVDGAKVTEIDENGYRRVNGPFTGYNASVFIANQLWREVNAFGRELILGIDDGATDEIFKLIATNLNDYLLQMRDNGYSDAKASMSWIFRNRGGIHTASIGDTRICAVDANNQFVALTLSDFDPNSGRHNSYLLGQQFRRDYGLDLPNPLAQNMTSANHLVGSRRFSVTHLQTAHFPIGQFKKLFLMTDGFYNAINGQGSMRQSISLAEFCTAGMSAAEILYIANSQGRLADDATIAHINPNSGLANGSYAYDQNGGVTLSDWCRRNPPIQKSLLSKGVETVNNLKRGIHQRLGTYY